MTVFFISVVSFSLRVEDTASSLSSKIHFSFSSRTPALASVHGRDFPVFLFFSIVCAYVLTLFSNLDRIIPSFVSAHSAAEDSSDRFLHDDSNACC